MEEATHLVDYVPRAVDAVLTEMLTDLYNRGGQGELINGPLEGKTTLVQDDAKVHIELDIVLTLRLEEKVTAETP